MEHRNIAGLDALHQFSLRSAVDPGAIGAEKGWLDTSTNPPRLKVRNATNDGWDEPAGPALDADVPPGRTTPDITQYLAKNARYNPRDYQLDPALDIGNGVLDARPAFVAAEAAAPATAGLTLEVGVYNIQATQAWTRRHVVPIGAMFKIPGGVNLHFAKGLDAGPYQIFDTTGGGTVTFGEGVEKVFPQWWGARNGQAFDSQPALQACMNAVADGGRILLTPDADFWIRSSIVRRKRTGIIVKGIELQGGDTQTPGITWDGPYGGRVFADDRTSYTVFDGIRVRMSPQTGSAEFTKRAAGVAGTNVVTIPSNTGFFKFKPEWNGRKVVLVGGGYGGGDLQNATMTFVSETQITLDKNILTNCGPTLLYIGSVNGGFPAMAAFDYHGMNTDGHSEGFQARTVNGSDVVEIWYSSEYGTPEDRGIITAIFPDWVGRTINAGAAVVDKVITEYLSPTKVRIAANATATGTYAWNVTGAGGVVGGIGTANRNVNCMVYSPAPHPLMQACRIGCDTISNHEFYYIDQLNVQLNGVGGVAINGAAARINATTLTNVVTWVGGGAITEGEEGHRFQIEGAGPGGGTLDTVITRVVGANITLRDAVSTLKNNAWTTLYGVGGYGIVIPLSANSHGHIFRNYQINGVRFAVLSGGGYVSENGRCGAGVGTMHCIWATSRPTYLFGDIQEGIETFLDYSGTALYAIGPAVGSAWSRPKGALYRFWGAAVAEIIEAEFDEIAPTTDRGGLQLVDYRNLGGGCDITWIKPMWRGGGTRTEQEVGLADAPFGAGHIEIIGGSQIVGGTRSGIPTAGYRHQTHFATSEYRNLGRDSEGPVSWVERRNGEPSGTSVVHRSMHTGADANPWRDEHWVPGGLDLPNYGADYESIIYGMIGLRTDYTSYAGFRSRVKIDNGNTPTIEHFSAESLEAPGAVGGGGKTIFAFRAKDMGAGFRSGGAATRGFWQDGALDPNKFASQTSFGAGVSLGAVVGVIVIAAGGNATPNAAGAEVYRYRGDGNVTINDPTNPSEGASLILELLNNTAGAITVTLGAAFLGTFPPPGAGKWRTQAYVYDATLAKWKPRGGQSGDL